MFETLGVLFDGSSPSIAALETALALCKQSIGGSVKMFAFQKRNKTYTPPHFNQQKLRDKVTQIKEMYLGIKIIQDWRIVNLWSHLILELSYWDSMGVKVVKSLILTSSHLLSNVFRQLLIQGKRNIMHIKQPLRNSGYIRVTMCFDGSDASFNRLQHLRYFKNCQINLIICPFIKSNTFLKSTKKLLSVNQVYKELNPKIIILQQRQNCDGLIEWLNDSSTDLVIIGKNGRSQSKGYGRVCMQVVLHCDKNLLVLND